MTPGVEVITIGHGEGVIAYQCEEGLVPEGRVEAMCGDDGRWSPDPTQHMCTTLTTIPPTTTTTTDATGTTCPTISTTCTPQGNNYQHVYVYYVMFSYSLF